jgi:hypothetical protein
MICFTISSLFLFDTNITGVRIEVLYTGFTGTNIIEASDICRQGVYRFV